MLGLVCDPVAGLVEVPCVKRNAMGAANALVAADMALAGVTSRIPCDEVIDAMYKIGQSMPTALKETAQGGLAATPTGKGLEAKIFGGAVCKWKQLIKDELVTSLKGVGSGTANSITRVGN